MAARLFFAVFKSHLPKHRCSTPSPLVHRFLEALEFDTWTYDAGDDPAFFSAMALRGPVTWGICRPPVRNTIAKGDVVVFFSVCPPDEASDAHSYHFCGALTVAEKISQTDIWRIRRHRRFRRYLNLLIRPQGNSWRHHEPALHERHWHDDWLWRMTSGHDGVSKAAFTALSDKYTAPGKLRIGGHSIEFADNYVIFSNRNSESFVHMSPPVVAYWSNGADRERWERTPLPRAIYEHTIARSNRRESLRIANQMAHPHIMTPLPPEGARHYIKQLRDVCSELSGKGRTGRSRAKRRRAHGAHAPC